MTTAQIIIALLGTSSLAAVVGAIATGLVNRKKLGAEATEIITKAASGTVERIEAENARIRVENADLRKRIEGMEEEQASWSAVVDRWARVLQLHAAWDHMAVTKLRECGVVDLPDPPPLYPPNPHPMDFAG